MNYAVSVLAKAEHDVSVILTWLGKRSPRGAATWFKRFVEACDTL